MEETSIRPPGSVPGSIVAREYGIPAVLATGNGTRRIRSGQTITVDGSTGTVTLGSI